MSSPSSVLSQGFGSWGSASLVVTLGFGSGVAAVIDSADLFAIGPINRLEATAPINRLEATARPNRLEVDP